MATSGKDTLARVVSHVTLSFSVVDEKANLIKKGRRCHWLLPAVQNQYISIRHVEDQIK
jgi:hypothetical protein